MNNPRQNGFEKHLNSGIYVLDGLTPDVVARNVIETGKQKEPFFVFDMDEACRRIQYFKEKMPRVKIFYAMKSNDTELMMKLAIALGVGFDCSAPGEIHKVRQLNVSPTSIIYTMPTKTREQMTYARESGVKHTTFDSANELKKLKQYWPDAKLLIRLRIDSVSLIPLGEKFGCDFDTEAVDLLEEAASLGLQVVGVAFHVGCVCSSLDSYRIGLQHARDLFDHEARAGRGMNIVDIGGGFPGDRIDRIDEVSKIINKALNELFPDPSIQVIAEPGRYLSDSAFTLYCSISNVRRIKKDSKTINMVYLNDGRYGTMRYPQKWHIISKCMRDGEEDKGDLEETIFWGPSCDSLDLVKKVYLPRCTPLDWLVFQIHGAYTISFSTIFSSLGIPQIRPVVSMDLWNKLKCETVYKASDFIINADLTLPLPSTLPPLQPTNEIREHAHTKNSQTNGFGKHSSSGIYVLDGLKPDVVAKNAIKGGKQEKPFYVFDMDEASCRILHFKDVMPRVKIFYAMKSNDTELMLKLAIALGVGFDCASPGEIYKIRQLNGSPANIIYAMPTKTAEQMMYARESGIKHTTFDTSYELKKLKNYWPDAKLLIRLRINGVSSIPLGDKFGCDVEAVELLEEAASLGLQVVGVAFHVGCVCSSLDSYRIGLQRARDLFDHEARAGRGMNIVDIGGGFPGDRTDGIDEAAELVNKTLEELFPDPSVQVIAEPGRYLTDSAFTLYCSINNVRRIKKDGKTINMVYLNDGKYGTLGYLEESHKISWFMRDGEKDPGLLEETIFWGPSCDSLDLVRKVQLPRCTPLDWLVVQLHGAYTMVFASPFSSLELPQIRPVVSMELWNKLKEQPIFKPSDFIVNPDLTLPLPSTLPSILPRNVIRENSKVPTLHD